MMKMWLIYSVLVLSMCGSAASSEFHIFTVNDGRNVEARIVDHDASRGRVKIQRRDGTAVWVNSSVFDALDQKYINEWAAVAVFKSESLLQIKVEKERVKNPPAWKKADVYSSQGDGYIGEVEYWKYNVTFSNRADRKQGYKIEYKMYIKNEGTGQNKDSLRVEKGLLTTLVEPKSSRVMTTGVVDLKSFYKGDKNSSTSGRRKQSEEELVGIWIRVHGPQFEGEYLMRDVLYPPALNKKYTW